MDNSKTFISKILRNSSNITKQKQTFSNEKYKSNFSLNKPNYKDNSHININILHHRKYEETNKLSSQFIKDEIMKIKKKSGHSQNKHNNLIQEYSKKFEKIRNHSNSNQKEIQVKNPLKINLKTRKNESFSPFSQLITRSSLHQKGSNFKVFQNLAKNSDYITQLAHVKKLFRNRKELERSDNSQNKSSNNNSTDLNDLRKNFIQTLKSKYPLQKTKTNNSSISFSKSISLKNTRNKDLIQCSKSFDQGNLENSNFGFSFIHEKCEEKEKEKPKKMLSNNMKNTFNFGLSQIDQFSFEFQIENKNLTKETTKASILNRYEFDSIEDMHYMFVNFVKFSQKLEICFKDIEEKLITEKGNILLFNKEIDID